MSVKSQIVQANAHVIGAVRRLPFQLRSLLRNRAEETVAAPIPGMTLRERQADLASFYTRYEDLVELICDASQYGPNPALETRYAEVRGWMMRAYPTLRTYVIAFLDHQVNDAEQSMDLYGHPTDAFEALYSSPTLHALTKTDDGNMIGRIVRTRNALNRYGEHLRKLAA